MTFNEEQEAALVRLTAAVPPLRIAAEMAKILSDGREVKFGVVSQTDVGLVPIASFDAEEFLKDLELFTQVKPLEEKSRG